MTSTATALNIVPSYLEGSWWAPETAPANAPIARDANTGEALATVSSDGVDLAAVVRYGRETGQRNLGDFTISPARAQAQRACPVPQ